MFPAAILAAIGISMVPARAVDWSHLSLTNVAQVETAEALVVAPIPPIDLHALAKSEAIKYGLNDREFSAVITCESGWDPSIQSGYPDPTGPNGKEDSWGLVQIHLPAHKEITKEQALDPVFALRFMAEEWRAGNANSWSCYKLMNAYTTTT